MSVNNSEDASMFRLFGWRALLGIAVALIVAAVAQAAAPEPLTIERALARALGAAPDLAAAASRIDAAEAGRIQAGVKPNPTLAEIENLAGTGSLGFVKRTELTATYSQTIERGGKPRRASRLPSATSLWPKRNRRWSASISSSVWSRLISQRSRRKPRLRLPPTGWS
jgi:hypothetical protein